MLGDILCQVVFVESSDDRACNPDSSIYTENWDWDDEVGSPEAIWAAIMQDVRATFMDVEPNAYARFIFPSPVVEEVSYEPIRMPFSQHFWWLNEAYANLGYTDNSYIRSGFDYNHDLRARYGVDWSFHLFENNAQCDEDCCWPGTTAGAYAIYFGPFAVLKYCGGDPSQHMYAGHEVAHLFGAGDEYEDHCGCGVPLGYLQVPHNNCLHCETHVPCLMNGQSAEMCQWTKGQIGWWDTDEDGALDPIDHPRSGRAVMLGDDEDPLVEGDRLLIYDGERFVKSIAVSRWNSDAGRVAWDGITCQGDSAAFGTYTWSRVGEEGEELNLILDEEEPVLSDVEIITQEGEQHLRVRFNDGDTHGCNIRADTYPIYNPGSTHRRIFDEFVFGRGDSLYADLPFKEEEDGYYEMDLFMWDVGGGHNIKETIPFQVVSGLEETVYLPDLRLGRGSPNPAGSWVRWQVSSDFAGMATMKIIGVDGRTVRIWRDRVLPAGGLTLLWDTRDSQGRRVASGKYFLMVEGNGKRRVVGSAVLVR